MSIDGAVHDTLALVVNRRSTVWLHLGLLWLSGNVLRMTLLAVPPLLPSIHRQLGLSESLVGALTGLPVLLLSLGAIFGSLLVATAGARRALLVGLCLVAVGGAARGLGSSITVLFFMTIVMGMGIAVSQPTLPSLVKRWFPQSAGFATTVYANGLLIGEITAAAFTVPFVLPLAGNRWQFAFLLWSIPVVLTAITILVFTRHEPRDPHMPPVQWWPDWRSGRTWRLGLILGCASVAYFGSNAFIPDYLKATHHVGLIPIALTSLNLSQLPASLLAAFFSKSLVARRAPLALAGILTLASAAGFYMGGVWVVVWAAVLGFSTALVFVLSLALPPLLTREDDVHRLTAAMFTITYACSFAGSLTGGAIWDITGIPLAAFVPVGGAGLLLIVLVRRLHLPSASISGTGADLVRIPSRYNSV
ncbi:MAG: MFS transporter [Chloroflexota bacterium]